MVMIGDYHVHTRHSDGKGAMAACVEQAIALGLPEIGFSDHLVPAGKDYEAYGIGPAANLDQYVAEVRATAACYPQIRVLLGLEVDYVPGTEDEIAALLARHRFDYLLGSVHFVDGFGFDEGRSRDDPRWQDVDAIYRGYYRTLRRAVETGRFTAIGHFDLPKKFGRRPSSALTACEDEVLAAAAAAGMVIEVNTAGLRRPEVGETYPAADVLARARRLGIRVVFGSDAHRSEDVGAGFAQAAACARAAGYESTLRLSDGAQVRLP